MPSGACFTGISDARGEGGGPSYGDCRDLDQAAQMATVTLPDGQGVAGIGRRHTWRMGERSATKRGAEVAAIRKAIELGYRVIDTAEMYGEGGAEKIVGTAIADALRAGDVRREELFIVSKVYPHNAGAKDATAACERSLARLGLDRIDGYLLHWRGGAAFGNGRRIRRLCVTRVGLVCGASATSTTATCASLSASPGRRPLRHQPDLLPG